MTIKPSSHPSSGWHKGNSHPSQGWRSLCCFCATQLLIHLEHKMASCGNFLFPPAPFSWFLSLGSGLWNLHRDHRDTELRTRKGSPCCLHVTATTFCCPSQLCRAPSPPAVLGFHLCSHFECNTSPGLKKNPARASFWRAKRIIAWKP